MISCVGYVQESAMRDLIEVSPATTPVKEEDNGNGVAYTPSSDDGSDFLSKGKALQSLFNSPTPNPSTAVFVPLRKKPSHEKAQGETAEEGEDNLGRWWPPKKKTIPVIKKKKVDKVKKSRRMPEG